MLTLGNRGDQVRQIGNAVSVGLATALCRELLRPAETIAAANRAVG